MEDRVRDNFTNRSEESSESLEHPQQEIGGQKNPTETELLSTILGNPEVLAVLHQKFKELEKPEGQWNWKKPLYAVAGFFQFLRACAMSPSSLKAVLLLLWTKLLHVFNMVSEIWKGKRTRLSEVQRNLRAVNETHEKVLGNVEEVEDQIRKTLENDYKISSTESKDLEIKLITARRDLGDCEDGLVDVHLDVERLRAGVLYYFFNQTSLFSGIEEDFDKDDKTPWNRPANESVHTAVRGLTTAGSMMIAVSVAVLCLPLKWMIESLIITSWLLTECEKVLEDDFQKANRLQKKLKRAVEKEVPEMKKQLVVLECDLSRYASLQKLDSD